MAGFDEYDSRDVTIAFVCVFLAGGCTCIGALPVFIPALVHLASKRVLAAALAFAAGAMLYVSLIDIYGKSQDGFVSNNISDGQAVIYTTLCFFAGIFIMAGLNQLVERLIECTGQANVLDIMDEFVEKSDEDGEVMYSEEEKLALKSMGYTTALAMALHNFPEGLLTFVGYLSDPVIGLALTVGIGAHNIPEGLSVAMPIYYATGSRLRGFLWALFSGLTEPLGAAVGYFIIKSNLSDNTYGIMFGVVAGIMTFISIDYLLPFASRYDPERAVFTGSAVTGMVFIAGSLMLFSI